MSFGAVAAVVGIGAAVGSAYMSNKGAQAAIGAQKNGLNALQPLDADELSKIASEGDLKQYQAGFKTQRDVDPATASMRTRGAQELLHSLGIDISGKSLADVSLKERAADLSAEKESTQSIIADLIDRAKADLDAGATLPPEFQAELVKSGLESAGKGGLSIEGKGQAGVDIRRLLGSEGLALKERREANALRGLGGAEALRTRRSNALADIIQQDNLLRDAKFNRTGQLAKMGYGAIPKIGLSGEDLVRISAQNTEFENNRIMGKANLKAQSKASNAGMWSGIIGAGGSAISGGLGGSSGSGGWLTNLFRSTPAAGTGYAQEGGGVDSNNRWQ